ncbi:ABC transporter [Spongiactinospora gelatinilytica]|uniref:ABC transporter n=1 Tax=Spongiactinospora gelatinilytica TaxID=2666298 RepID=A0A2W2G3P5_9ACTN|nr:phosphate ABC transporter substrate-binding protein [Spongiactinospora gelatinilytica]PZG42761.1 ABC transporter [Spongiactinospora gelatinilytica]
MNQPHLWQAGRGLTRLAALGAALLLCLASAACTGKDGKRRNVLRVSGSTTVNPVAADVADVLRSQGMEVTIDTQGGSAGGISQLGAGQIDIAMSSKPLADADRKRFPGINLVATEIGRDAVGIVVRKSVHDSGVTSLTRTQLARIFEGKAASWKEFGGPDLPVYVYDKEPGRGTREVLDKYLYEEAATPPPVQPNGRYAIVGGNEETRTKLRTTEGSVAPLSAAFVEGSKELALVAVDDVPLTPQNIVSGKYPLARPLFLITNGSPQGNARTFIDRVLSAEGQKVVTQHGYLNLAQLGKR